MVSNTVDIRAMLQKKHEKKNSKLVMKDVNRGLIIALTALPVYGKEVRDEEILSIIINGGAKSNCVYDQIKDNFNKRLQNKEIKKVKGEYRDTDGFLVLVPNM